MATPRSLQLRSAGGQGHYFHVVSRVVDRRFVFGGAEKAAFARLLRKVETFCAVEVVTWTILSNHFHILVYIPQKDAEVDEATFWHRLGALYSKDALADIQETLRHITASTPGPTGVLLAQAYRQRFIRRMRDLSQFMQTLKQRFSTWFNQRHERTGTLWEARYKSVLLEGDPACLVAVAAYIDLNAVRAGVVGDPSHYNWCGYAEAVKHDGNARRGLAHIYNQTATTWPSWHDDYRGLLLGLADQPSSPPSTPPSRPPSGTPSPSRQKPDAALNLPALLRCRVRYFTDSLVLGRAPFVDAAVETHPERFGKNRRSGARKMAGGDWGALRSLRDLKRSPIVPPIVPPQ